MQTPRIRFKSHADGNVTFRSTIHSTIWQIVLKWSETMGISSTQAFWFFQMRIVSLIESGDYEFLGPEFGRVINGLITNDKIGVGGAPPIDISVLHRSTKTKSGFVGVYANGQGFRAVGPTGNAIKTCQTAEAAAWVRYLFYKKEGLPYGAAEDLVEVERKRVAAQVAISRDLLGFDATDEAMLEFTNGSFQDMGKRQITMEEMKGGEIKLPSKPEPERSLMPIGFDRSLDKIDRDV